MKKNLKNKLSKFIVCTLLTSILTAAFIVPTITAECPVTYDIREDYTN